MAFISGKVLWRRVLPTVLLYTCLPVSCGCGKWQGSPNCSPPVFVFCGVEQMAVASEKLLWRVSPAVLYILFRILPARLNVVFFNCLPPLCRKRPRNVVPGEWLIFWGIRGDFRMTDVLNPSYFVDPEAPADWFISFPLKDLVQKDVDD